MLHAVKGINIIYRIATGSRRIRNVLTPVGFIFFVGLVLLTIFVSLQIDISLHLPKFISEKLHLIVSVPIIAIGSLMILWSMLHFFIFSGTPVPFNPPPRLVTTGPYAYVRNPMLAGVFILLFGFGLYFRSISLFFIFAPLFILLNLIELKVIEEPELEKRLGKEYVDYKNRVPMFFPRLKTKVRNRTNQ